MSGELLLDTGALVSNASLVVLAEELRTKTLLTTDRRDFAVYRIRGGTRFELLPPLP